LNKTDLTSEMDK